MKILVYAFLNCEGFYIKPRDREWAGRRDLDLIRILVQTLNRKTNRSIDRTLCRVDTSSFLGLPAGFSHAGNLSVACETTEFVTRKSELTKETTSSARVTATIANTSRCAVLRKFVEFRTSFLALFFREFSY